MKNTRGGFPPTSSPTRLRLTLYALAVLALLVGLLTLAFYGILLSLTVGAAAVGALVLSLLASDLVVLGLGALGCYVLVGRVLRPVAAARARQERFAVAASHELRTPLTVLLGTLEAALLRRRAPEQYEEVLERARDEATHLVTLLADVLDLAHAEGGAETSTREHLDLSVLARAAIEDVRFVANGKRQTLVVTLTEPLFAHGDARALQRAVAALLDNAVTYTPDGGMIHVVGRRGRGRALVVVRDTGPGIAPEHLPYLFEPFYRVDPARGAGDGHTGLGLVRAARVARAHGGRLAIESKEGVGTAATLTLPLARRWRLTPHGVHRSRALKRPRSVDPAGHARVLFSDSSQEDFLNFPLYPLAHQTRPSEEAARGGPEGAVRRQWTREGERHGEQSRARGSTRRPPHGGAG